MAPPTGRSLRDDDEMDVSAQTGDHPAAIRRRPGRPRGTTRSAVALAVVALVALTLPVSDVGAKPVCAAGEFYARGQCFACSACPDYLIVRRPCTRTSDTFCGPLYDFEFLNTVKGDRGGRQSGTRNAAPPAAGRVNRLRIKPPQSAKTASTSSNAVIDIPSLDSGMHACATLFT